MQYEKHIRARTPCANCTNWAKAPFEKSEWASIVLAALQSVRDRCTKSNYSKCWFFFICPKLKEAKTQAVNTGYSGRSCSIVGKKPLFWEVAIYIYWKTCHRFLVNEYLNRGGPEEVNKLNSWFNSMCIYSGRTRTSAAVGQFCCFIGGL